MRISHQHKLIFLSMPRAGSITVRNVLDQHSDIKSVHISGVSDDFPFFHHMFAAELKPAFIAKGWNWDEYRKFCILRNPYDRVVSLYHLTLKILEGQKSKTLKGRLLGRFSPALTFEEYVYSIDTKSHLPCSVASFAHAPNGDCLVDDFLMFDRLSEELSQYLSSHGIPTAASDIPRLNASENRGKYRDYYNDETRAFVADKYRDEIERFGYEF